MSAYDDGLPHPPSDSAWDRLSSSEQFFVLRQHQNLLALRHQELIAGQRQLSGTVEQHVKTLKEQAACLKENTETTKRIGAKIDEFIDRSETVLSFFNDSAAGLRVLGLIGDMGRKLAWFVLPFGALFAAWHATKAWLKT